MTLVDDKGLSGSPSINVVISDPLPTPEPGNPPVSIITTADQGIVGQAVNFDASASQAANALVDFAWDFGDGTTADAVAVNKIYNSAGVFNIQLTVTDDQGLQDSDIHQITILEPTATTEPTATETPTVEATATETPTLEATATETSTVEATATETVTTEPTSTEEPTATTEATATTPAQPPQAVIEVSIEGLVIQAPISTTVGQTINFDGSSSQQGDGPITTYLWDFGSGQDVAAGPQTSFSYDMSAIYIVRLTIKDENGQEDFTEINIEVNPGDGGEGG